MKKIQLALLVALSLLLAACGDITAVSPSAPADDDGASTASAAPTEAEPEAVTISIWHGWQGEYFNSISEVFDRYMEANPHVTIELTEVTDLSDQIVIAVPAGEGPDIVAFANDWIGRLAETNVIVPLDEHIDRAEYEATFTETAVASQTYEDQIWGFPEAMEALTFIYNRDLISEDELPADTDELLEQAAAWRADNPDDYYFVYNAKNDAYFSAPWFYGAGAYFVHDDGSVGLDTPEGLAAAEFVADLREVMPEEIDYAIADTLFKEGRAPITMNGPWYLADLEAAGIDYGIATIPVMSSSGEPAVPFVGVKTLMVTANAEHPDVAVDVLEFFTSAEQQVFLAEANQTIPTNQAALEDTAVQELESVVRISEQAARGTPLPNTPFMSSLWDPVAQMLEGIWTGAATPAEAITNAQDAAEANIEQMQ